MAIVLFGGTYAAQPAQASMRRFVARTRVDGSVTAVNLADTNKLMKIAKGWVVNSVWVNIVKQQSNCWYGAFNIIDNNSQTMCAQVLGGTYDASSGPTAGPGGQFLYATAAYLAMSLSASYTVASGGFNGIVDVFADITDLNAYESPHSPSWAD